MEPIRTPKGKLYGMFDTVRRVLHIKDGATTRLIQVPPCGLTLTYSPGNGEPETVYIPPTAATAA